MKRRPIVFLLLPYLLGILIADISSISISAAYLQYSFILFIIIALVMMQPFPVLSFYILLFLVGLTGLLRFQFKNDELCNQTIQQFLDLPHTVSLKGVIQSAPEKRTDRLRFVLNVDSIGVADTYFPATGNILMLANKIDERLQRGQKVQAAGRLVRPDPQRNPGEFNYRLYLKRKGISGLFYVAPQNSVQIKAQGFYKNWRFWIFDHPRNKIAGILDTHLQEKSSGLIKSLLLGVRGELSPDIKSDFAAAGVFHVLAVSGLHVGFVILILLGVCSILRCSIFIRTVILIIGLVYYAGLTGFKPPVVRAVIMADLYFIGRFLQRELDVYNILAAAAGIILLLDPNTLFDVGFQFSFVSVFSIVFFYQKLHPILIRNPSAGYKGVQKLFHFLFELMLVTICAQIGSTLLVILYFHRISLFTTFANLIVVPLVQVLVILGFSLIGLHVISALLAGWLGKLISLLCKLLFAVTRWISNLPFATIENIYLPTILIVTLAALVTALLVFRPRLRLVHALYFLLGCINIWIWYPQFCESCLQVTFLDVGQGDAAVVELPGKHAIVIDTGPRTQKYDAGKQTIIPFLKRSHINSLDAIFISHFHNDHFGGAPSLLRGMRVNSVFMIPQVHAQSKEDYQNLMRLCDSLNVPIHFATAGVSLPQFPPLQIQILAPLPFMLKNNDKFDLNNASLVLRLIYKHHLFLFCGDIEHESEQYITMMDSLLCADVLKIPHHGSQTSNTIPFLKKVNPDWAVISVGKWNRFHQPSQLVLGRLDSLSIPFIRTDKNGAVVFRSDGKILTRLR